jgi:hypothetical protein
MAQPPNSIEKDGRRLVVYSRQYNGIVWEVKHRLPDDYFLAQAFTLDYDNIYPKRVVKLTNDTVLMFFEKPVSGFASIFHLTPLLKRRRIVFNNVTSVNLDHKYGDTDYLLQFWRMSDEGYYELFMPKNVEKIDNFTATATFEYPHSGYVDFGKSFPKERMIQVSDKLWEYRHMANIANRAQMFVQCTGSDDFMFVPDRLSRLENKLQLDSLGNSPSFIQTENILEIEHDDPLTGTINTIIHGNRI